MSNHDIECEFCGKDQRFYYNNCCQAYIDHQRKEKDQQIAIENKNRKFLKKYGLQLQFDALCNFTKLNASDVIRVLKKLDK